MHTITDLKDFDPKTTIVIDGDADFECYPEITDLGNLKEITGCADFQKSQVQNLGNLQTIGDWAYFQNSQVKDLGNLQTIGGWAYFHNSQFQDLGNLQKIGGYADFGNRLDLKAEWEVKQNKTTNKMHTITNLKDFDPKTTEIIDGNADFSQFQSINDLGVLLEIRGYAFFQDSQIQSLGKLQKICGNAYFKNSQVQNLGNLQTIKGFIYWGSRTDLRAEWKSRKEKSKKTFENTDSNGAKKNVSDIQFWGDGDTFKLISKAWSKSEGWMKLTKAMEIPSIGCVVQVTTQQGESVAEALTFVPNTKIVDVLNSEGVVIGRKLSNINIS